MNTNKALHSIATRSTTAGRFCVVCCALLTTLSLQAGTNHIQLLSEFFITGSGPAAPYARLVQGTNGDFYGTSYGGGTAGWGSVFKVGATGGVTTIYSFDQTSGANPKEGGLMRASDGYFYANTYIGGAMGQGCVFRISHSGAYSNLVSFRGTNGSYPSGWLVQAADGNFYGTTFGGGAGNSGTIYRLTPTWTLTRLHTFYGTNGANPYAGLVAANDGNFYGTTYSGGSNDMGIVFRFSTNGTFTLLTQFTGTNGAVLGANPRGALALGADGLLYGTTESGGATDAGTIFRISTNGAFTSLFTFSKTNGANPESSLVAGPDLRLYGTTYGTASGGSASNGTVFAISTSGAFEHLANFNFTNGPGPFASLTLGSDGNLYGATVEGGYDGVGAIYRVVSTPVMKSVVASNNTARITWSSFSNGLYRVEYKTPVTSATWTPLAGDVTATNTTAFKNDPITGDQKYYRIRLLP